MPQDGFEDAPRGLKIAPIPFQEAKKLPKEAPKRPRPSKNVKKINAVCLLAFSLPMAIRCLKMASRWPKRAPRGAQESPKTAPRALQERLTRGPRGDFWGSRGRARTSAPPPLTELHPSGPGRRPRGSKRAPRGPQEAPKRPPRGLTTTGLYVLRTCTPRSERNT